MKTFSPDPGEMFTLKDLGVIDGPRSPGFDRITALGERLMPKSSCILALKDADAARVRVRSSGPLARARSQQTSLLLEGSLTECVCHEGQLLTEEDAHLWSPTMPEIQTQSACFFAASPVQGPAGDDVGMIALMSATPFRTTDDVAMEATTLAALVSQRILLIATLATLHRVATEREYIGTPPMHKH